MAATERSLFVIIVLKSDKPVRKVLRRQTFSLYTFLQTFGRAYENIRGNFTGDQRERTQPDQNDGAQKYV